MTADPIDEVAADCERVSVYPAAWLRADGRPIAVTINGGARYTRTRHVRLTIRAPDAAAYLRISNDYGFGAFVRARREAHERYRFELAAGGPQQRTVHVRFDGHGLDPDRTLTDGIVLDETRPKLRRVRVLRRHRRGLRVTLRARDSTSGVRWAQFARVRGRPFARVRYRKRVTTRASARWARVVDRAGNPSRWRRVGR